MMMNQYLNELMSRDLVHDSSSYFTHRDASYLHEKVIVANKRSRKMWEVLKTANPHPNSRLPFIQGPRSERPKLGPGH